MKDLKDMSLEELWQIFPIILKEHNPQYKDWYNKEKAQLLLALGSYNIYRVSHIGSTAVAGLIAKPIIDILLELPCGYNVKAVARQCQKNGWLLMAEDTAGQTLDLNKGYTPNGFAERVYHLHIKPLGDWGELYFRDYLQQNAAAAHAYAALKLSLLNKFKNNRDAYTEAKTDFITQYTRKAKEEYKGRYIPL